MTKTMFSTKTLASTKTLLFAATAALALMTGAANAQFAERTIRISNGVNADHPVGNGVTKMAA